MFPLEPDPSSDADRPRRARARNSGEAPSPFDFEGASDADAGEQPTTPVQPAFRNKPSAWASRFEELSVNLGGDIVEFVHVRSNEIAQNIALGISTAVFVVFVVSVMPLMGLTWIGNGLWIVLGIAALAIVAMVMQARVQTTRLRLSRTGLDIQQGTAVDQESIVVLWEQLAGVDLEPVNEKDGRKGMRLRLRLSEGEPIDTLDGVAVGELNDVRRVVMESIARHRLNASR